MKLFLGTALVAVFLSCSSVWADCPPCGPNYCQVDTRIGPALAAKKQALKAAGYPDRLISLIDKGDQCYARITQSPDIFTMWIIDSGNNKQTVPWSKENEKNAMNKVKSQELKRFWIYNARRAFSCCNQPPYNSRPDYDSEDDVNSSTAIKCTKEAPCGQ